jgi:hypothetical protein
VIERQPARKSPIEELSRQTAVGAFPARRVEALREHRIGIATVAFDLEKRVEREFARIRL